MQATLFLASMPHTPSICAAAPFVHPAGQKQTRQLYRLINALANLLGSSIPTAGPSPAAAEPTHAARCASLILWLRLCLGLLAPLLHEALGEARLWRQHQAQRRAAGLPRERTRLARVYRAVYWLFWEDSAVHLSTVCLLLLAAAWDWCAYILVPRVLMKPGAEP